MVPPGPPSDPPDRPGRRRNRDADDWDWGDDEWEAPSTRRRGAQPEPPTTPQPKPSPTSAPARPSSDGAVRHPGVRRRRMLVGAGATVLLIVAILIVTSLARGGDDKQAAAAVPLLSGQLNAASTASLDSLQRMAAVDHYAKLGLPVYCGAATKPWVALTFDDGPSRELSPKFIALLSKEKVPATMFRIGRNIPGNEKYVEVQRNLGWDSGSHTMTHPPLASLSEKAQRAEITGGNRASQRALGRKPELFRPPYESHNSTTDKIVKDNGQVQVLWNVDTQDALGATSAASIAQTAIKGLRPGSIILMHEVKANTFAALPAIIAEMRKRNLQPVTVSKMLAGDPPTEKQLKAGFSGCPVDLTEGKAAS